MCLDSFQKVRKLSIFKIFKIFKQKKVEILFYSTYCLSASFWDDIEFLTCPTHDSRVYKFIGKHAREQRKVKIFRIRTILKSSIKIKLGNVLKLVNGIENELTKKSNRQGIVEHLRIDSVTSVHSHTLKEMTINYFICHRKLLYLAPEVLPHPWHP